VGWRGTSFGFSVLSFFPEGSRKQIFILSQVEVT
jgi:hypothetical protein